MRSVSRAGKNIKVLVKFVLQSKRMSGLPLLTNGDDIVESYNYSGR